MPEAIATQPQSHLIRVLSSTGRMPNPLPLLTTKYDIQIHGGLAIVTEHREFENSEEQSVEATLTFPVPVHAVLHHLSAKIGPRTLIARAKRKDVAREDYEDAIDCGKFSVLHEEVLRGVHMLSVGHLPPKQPVTVISRWCMSLAWMDNRAQFRIPVTVGDIYGETPLSDVDDLITDGPVLTGSISVQSVTGGVTVNGVGVTGEPLSITLDSPLNIVVPNWQPADVVGVSADGRKVALAIEPATSTDKTIEAAVLVDHSGSMQGAVDNSSSAITVHEAVCNGLRSAAQGLPDNSQIDLWEFDTEVDFVGSADNTVSLQLKVDELCEPRDGTEIGRALEHVSARTSVRDIILITDGKSYSLNVQALARRGKRITVVLVGQDSLEANVGHLAALTGGEIFVALDGDVAPAILSSFKAVARPQRREICEVEDFTSQYRSGMDVSVQWSSRAGSVRDDALPENLAVAAFSASLALPMLEAKGAAKLAEEEGIVSHLTSLILVDHNGKRQSGLPAMRKIAAPRAATPRASKRSVRSTASRAPALRALYSAAPEVGVDRATSRQKFSHGRSKSVIIEPRRKRAAIAASRPSNGKLDQLFARLLAPHSGKIDWANATKALEKGDLSGIPAVLAVKLEIAAHDPRLKAKADQLDMDPLVLAIGLLARLAASGDRAAERIARRIFKEKSKTVIEEMMAELKG